MSKQADSLKSPPQEGIYVHGLFLEGATWSKGEGNVTESEPKVLYTPLPVLYVTANHYREEAKVRREVYGAIGPYECPCYKYRTRTDRYLIFSVTLKATDAKPPAFWTLRGLSLLCNTD